MQLRNCTVMVAPVLNEKKDQRKRGKEREREKKNQQNSLYANSNNETFLSSTLLAKHEWKAVVVNGWNSVLSKFECNKKVKNPITKEKNYNIYIIS